MHAGTTNSLLLPLLLLPPLQGYGGLQLGNYVGFLAGCFCLSQVRVCLLVRPCPCPCPALPLPLRAGS